MVAQGDAARYEMAASAGRSALKAAIDDGAAPLPHRWLQDRIAQPLGETSADFHPKCESCIQERTAPLPHCWLQDHILHTHDLRLSRLNGVSFLPCSQGAADAGGRDGGLAARHSRHAARRAQGAT